VQSDRGHYALGREPARRGQIALEAPAGHRQALPAVGGKGGNKPPRKIATPKRRRPSTAEEDRLRQVLIAIINEFVAPVDPQRAAALLKQLYPEGDPNDSLDGMLDDAQDEESESDALGEFE
jgi:hypothetical protein